MFRKHGRTTIQCPVLLKHQKIGHIEALTRDISASGMFIGPEMDIPDEKLQAMAVDDEVEVHLANSENGIERMQLRIARFAENGWGLSFMFAKAAKAEKRN